MQPGSECTQFLQNRKQVSVKTLELDIEASSLRDVGRCKRPRPEGQRDDPLLRPIVEVAHRPGDAPRRRR